MDLIGFQQQSIALLLSNYLLEQGIANRVLDYDEQKGYVICLDSSEQAPLAKDIAQDFIRNPNHPKYQSSAWNNEQSVSAPLFSADSSSFSFSAFLTTPVISTVLILCILIYIGSLAGGFISLYGLLSIQPLQSLTENHQWWRLLTPALLHFSALHIVFNLLWWWTLGRNIESHLGSLFLLGFACISALTSNVAQLLVSGPNFGGLSGVVYALMGFVWFVGKQRPDFGYHLPNNIAIFMLAWLGLGYLDILWVDMANTAHTIGLVTGLAIASIVSIVVGKSKSTDTGIS